MRRLIRGTGWVLGLAILGMALGDGHSAQAAGVRVSGGGMKQFGDPFYFYIYELYLEPGYSFQLGDSLTLHMMAGVHSPGSTTSSPNGPPDPSGPWTPQFTNEPDGLLPNYLPPTPVRFADVTFYNLLNVIGPPGAEEYLGEFRVLTADSLPLLPDDYSVTIDWTAIIHDPNGDRVTETGKVTLGILVPEPASMVLLGAGVVLPLAWTLRRRRSA